jgi:FAD-dependent urate hydroxylase
MTTFENIIIGAGPYGLSIAAHLRGANVDYVILGKPMASWRNHMPARMMLKSENFASNLSDPGRRYTLEQFYGASGRTYAHKGVPLSIADFIDYADWFRRAAALEVWDSQVRNLRLSGSGFALTLDDREILANRVIVATGHLAFRHVPQALRHHAPALVSHSADHHDFANFSQRDVTVIGCGQSGLETAALLREQGASARVLARAPVVDWNPEIDPFASPWARLRRPESGLGPGWRSLGYSELPRVFFALPAAARARLLSNAHAPSGAWWLRNRLTGKVPLLTSHQVIAAAERNGRIELSVRNDRGTVQLVTDHVIAATGYRVDLGRLAFLDPTLRATIKAADGVPALNPVFESSVPGLHFVGLASAPSFGPVMRFVYGARHAATILTGHIRAAARRRSQSRNAVLGAKSVAR